MNRLGLYLLTSLLFVVGGMTEFAIVLLAKQKMDWNETDVATDSKASMTSFKQTGTHLNVNHRYKNTTAYRQKSSTKMPLYRKTDVIAFVLFNSFYALFIFIYFIICLNQ